MTDKEKIENLEQRIADLEKLVDKTISLFKAFGGAKAKIYLAALQIGN